MGTAAARRGSGNVYGPVRVGCDSSAALGAIPALYDVNNDGRRKVVDLRVEGNAAAGSGCAEK